MIDLSKFYTGQMPLTLTVERLKLMKVADINVYREAILKHRAFIVDEQKVNCINSLENYYTQQLTKLTKQLQVIDKYLKTKRNIKNR